MRSRRFRAAQLRTALASLALMAGPVLAAGSGSLVVNATVLSKNICKFQGATTWTINVSGINPSSTSDASASTTMTVRCNGSDPIASWAVTGDNGLYSTGPGARRMRHLVTTTQFLAYSLNVPAAASSAKGVDYPLVVTATVPVASFQDAIAGNYSDTVAISLDP